MLFCFKNKEEENGMSVHMFACVYMCVEIDGKSYLPNNIDYFR